MGILFVVGMMVYTVGLCHLLNRLARQSSEVQTPESEGNRPTTPLVIPDRVPPEWVDAYWTEHGG